MSQIKEKNISKCCLKKYSSCKQMKVSPPLRGYKKKMENSSKKLKWGER